MIDLVTANEFTFTPSAFIAAYIEQATTTSVTEETVNSGSISTLPNREIDDITTEASILFNKLNFSGLPIGTTFTGTVKESSLAQYEVATFVPGATFSPSGYTVAGTLTDVLGQNVTDGRSVTKTTTTSSGVVSASSVAQTVVLVLSYGQFRANCADAQTTVTLIYTRVAEYLNSLV